MCIQLIDFGMVKFRVSRTKLREWSKALSVIKSFGPGFNILGFEIAIRRKLTIKMDRMPTEYLLYSACCAKKTFAGDSLVTLYL